MVEPLTLEEIKALVLAAKDKEIEIYLTFETSIFPRRLKSDSFIVNHTKDYGYWRLGYRLGNSMTGVYLHPGIKVFDKFWLAWAYCVSQSGKLPRVDR